MNFINFLKKNLNKNRALAPFFPFVEVRQTDSKRTRTVMDKVKTKLCCPKGQKGWCKMKWLNCIKIRLVLVGFVVAIAIGIGGSACADFTFGTAVNLGPTVNTSSGDSVTCFSSDGLEMYLDSNRSGEYGGWDIWVAKRPTKDDHWGTPVNLGPTVNSSSMDGFSHISSDGLSLFFESKRPGGVGGGDIWVAKRATRNDAWGTPVNLGTPINTSGSDSAPRLSTDGLELYYCSSRGYGAHDIWVSRRATKNDRWGEPTNLGAVVNSSADEFFPFVSADGLALFFSGNRGQPLRPGGFGGADMWVTTRASVSEPWGTPVNLGPIVNTPSYDCGPVISPDGFMLYFCSERPGGLGGAYGDIYQAPIVPIVDFNGDRIVDAEDMCIMVNHWGEDYPLCDIGPMPWGDGIVDVEDLKVLAEHLFEEVNDPTLIAHWPLDEADGAIAYNCASTCDGILLGGPVWQPDSGIVNGSLQFDGIDDYVSTERVLNPADGKFSVVAWIKDGAPGQVVLSQADGLNWLCMDSVEGGLMTELTNTGRSSVGPMISQINITDGNWHRTGFVWDGSSRYLYVDGAEVAKDATPLSDLEGAEGGLYIGAGNTLAPGTFFSGLIDDIRIYNRVVSP